MEAYFYVGAGLLAVGGLLGFLGFVYEDPQYVESGVIEQFKGRMWISGNSGAASGYAEVFAVDTGAQRRWTLPMRVAQQHQDRLLALRGKYVKVVVAGAQAKEILQLDHEGDTVISLEDSLRYKAQGRAWFGWGGVIMMSVGALLLVWRLRAVGIEVSSLKAESK